MVGGGVGGGHIVGNLVGGLGQSVMGGTRVGSHGRGRAALGSGSWVGGARGRTPRSRSRSMARFHTVRVQRVHRTQTWVRLMRQGRGVLR